MHENSPDDNTQIVVRSVVGPVTDRRGQDDVGVLNLKEVLNLCVSSQLFADQAQMTKLLIPVVKALTAQSFDRSHWREEQKSLKKHILKN